MLPFASFRFFWILVFLSFLLVTGCGSEQPAAEAEDKSTGQIEAGGMAVIAIAGDPDVLNPLIRRSAISGQVLAEIMDTLTDINEELVNVPGVAGSWELADNKLSIQFTLKPCKWEDGHPLTTRDLAESFHLVKDPRVGSPFRGFYRHVERAEVLDDRNIVYHFSQVLPDPLSRINHPIVPWHRVKNLDPAKVDRWQMNENPLACGPFKLTQWDRSQSLVLERNETYQGTPAQLDRVTFRVLREATARVLALEAGEVDFVSNVSAQDAKRLKLRDDIEIMASGGRRFYQLIWNCRNPRLKDPLTRKALSLAIDRPRMVETLLEGFAEPAVSPIARVAWNHADELKADPWDPDRARAMLKEAGWVDKDNDGVLDRDGLSLEIEILTRQSDPVRSDGVVILRENLESVGARVQVRAMELAAGLDLVKAGRFDSYFGAMNPNTYGDPSSLVHTGAVDEFNSGFYSNAAVDSLLDEALGQPDRQLALPLWIELQAILQQDPPAAYLFCPQRLDAVSRRIQNVRPHVLSPLNNLSEWWIARDDRKYRTQRP